MAYTINIKYIGVEKDVTQIAAPICRIFAPCNSYVDLPAYSGTVYDTNVDGFGSIEQMEPFASTSIPFPVPMAQFKLAVVGENNEVEFDVDDYKEAFYYMQVGAAMKDQGFVVTAKKK